MGTPLRRLLLLLPLVLLRLRAALPSASLAVMDIFIAGHQVRSFSNVSLGLDHGDSGRQCPGKRAGASQVEPELLSSKVATSHHNDASRGVSGYAMSYTNNRRSQAATKEDAHKQRLQLAFVLALGGHSNQYYDYGKGGSLNGLLAVWDSWLENFFSRVSNSSSIVLLLDERDFNRQNHTRSRRAYADLVVAKNMGARPVDCVSVRSGRARRSRGSSSSGGAAVAESGRRSLLPSSAAGRRQRPPECGSHALDLDQGYFVYSVDFSHEANASYRHEFQKPFLIFASVHRFEPPEWARGQDEEQLYVHWRPWRMGRFKTNYGYVKMTNWYAYHMLNLRLLDFFDYAGKLDNDVSFVAPFPEPNLPRLMAEDSVKMLVSQNGWYNDEPRVAQGIRQCLAAYMEAESSYCFGQLRNRSVRQFVPGGHDSFALFWERNLNVTFRAHFLVFWLGLYSSPEVKALARHWNDWHPRGMWDYRWGDQQWWPRPLAMFSDGKIDQEIFHYDVINTDNERYVVHKEYPRSHTIPHTQYFLYEGGNRSYRSEQYERSKKGYRVWK